MSSIAQTIQVFADAQAKEKRARAERGRVGNALATTFRERWSEYEQLFAPLMEQAAEFDETYPEFPAIPFGEDGSQLGNNTVTQVDLSRDGIAVIHMLDVFRSEDQDMHASIPLAFLAEDGAETMRAAARRIAADMAPRIAEKERFAAEATREREQALLTELQLKYPSAG